MGKTSGIMVNLDASREFVNGQRPLWRRGKLWCIWPNTLNEKAVINRGTG